MRTKTSTLTPRRPRFVQRGPAPAGRWRRRMSARPAEVVAAAYEGIAERVYEATRLEDVATRAGVTKGTMYLYFDGKEALFKELVRRTALPAVESVEDLLRTHEGPARELVAA